MSTRQRKLFVQVFLVAFIIMLQSDLSLFAINDSKQPISEVLYEVISNEGIGAGVKKYHSLKKKQGKDYDFSETELNTLGYRFIREGKLPEAIAVFKLNTDAYPKSPNAFDSLAEAYLRSGKREKASELYEKSLAMLADADMDETRKDALKKNAEAKLGFLRDPESYQASTVLVDFLLNNDQHPYGKLHPKAPPETAHWGQLAGEWDCTIEALLPNGTWVQGGNAKWVWKYILDGFAVQDLWYQKWIDLPASLASINHDFAGTNIRMYLPAEKKWECVWFANATNTTSRFQAESSNEKIVMTGETKQGLTRITFYDITEDSFDWKSEQSQDDGETWTETLRIHGTRIAD